MSSGTTSRAPHHTRKSTTPHSASHKPHLQPDSPCTNTCPPTLPQTADCNDPGSVIQWSSGGGGGGTFTHCLQLTVDEDALLWMPVGSDFSASLLVRVSVVGARSAVCAWLRSLLAPTVMTLHHVCTPCACGCQPA